MNLSALFYLLIIAKSSNKQSITYYTSLKIFFSNILMVLFQEMCISYNFYQLCYNIFLFLIPDIKLFLVTLGSIYYLSMTVPDMCVCVVCVCMYIICRIVLICRFHQYQCSIEGFYQI